MMKQFYFLTLILLVFSSGVVANKLDTQTGNIVSINAITNDSIPANGTQNNPLYPGDASEIVVKTIIINPDAAPETKQQFYLQSGGSDTLVLYYNADGEQIENIEGIQRLENQKEKDKMTLKAYGVLKPEKNSKNNPKR